MGSYTIIQDDNFNKILQSYIHTYVYIYTHTIYCNVFYTGMQLFATNAHENGEHHVYKICNSTNICTKVAMPN